MPKKTEPTPKPAPPVPDPALWTTPLSWHGEPLQPSADDFYGYPPEAVYVRTAAELTIWTEVSPGWNQQTKSTAAALLRLEGGRPVELHLPGPDGACWTLRVAKLRKRQRWSLFAGGSYPGAEAREWPKVQRIDVQTLQPLHATGRHLTFAILDDGTHEADEHELYEDD